MVLLPTPKSNTTLTAIKGVSTILLSSSKTLSSSASSPTGTISDSLVEEIIENAVSIITKWDLNSSPIIKITSLFDHNRKEAQQFMQTVNDLRRAMHFLVSQHAASQKLVLAQNLMQIAMKRLEKEFYLILSANRNQLNPKSVSNGSSEGPTHFEDEVGFEDEIKIVNESITKVERVAAVAMSDLRSIADCMISSGYGRECIKIYKLLRRSIVDEGLYLFGIERYRPSHLQKMNGEALQHMINKWLDAVKIAVRTLFSGEKALCDHVFSASRTVREACFSEITSEGATNLFRFPELIAKTKKCPERIFPLMELYEALSDLRVEIELMFNSGSTSAIKLQALSSKQRLGESVRAILSDFESTIQKDSSKTPIAGGGIHLLTQRAMNYISALADYSVILSDIAAESPLPRNTQLRNPDSYFDSPTSDNGPTPTVSVQLAWLILVLLCKLDSKSELYKDASLSYLFLANNLHFIIEKVSTTRLKLLLGRDWVIMHIKKAKQYASSHEMMAWAKVFSSLPDKNSPELSPVAAKACFRRFNAAFEEVYKKHTLWIVPHGKLRDELKVSITKRLVPAYREFYDKYLLMMKGENLELLIRFGPDDLENYMSHLFHGASMSARSSSSSSFSYQGCIPR